MLRLRPCSLLRLDGMDLAQKLVRCNHRHPTKVGNEMNAISVTGDVALRALLRVLATRQHLATVAAPRWLQEEVLRSVEAMGYTVVDLVFVFFRFRVGLADAFGDNLRETFLMAGVSAVVALVSRTLEQEFSAIRALHDLVELMSDELVAVHLVDFVLVLLADGALTSKTSICRTFPHIFLDKVQV